MGVVHIGLKMSADELWRKVEGIARATLARAAFGRSGVRFYEGGSAVFEDGGGIIIRGSGYIIIDGDIDGVGDFDWAGTFKALGPWELIGTGKVTGNVTWSGDFTLTGDMIVTGGGKIGVGTNLQLLPGVNGGGIVFGDSSISETGGALILTRGGYTLTLSGSSAQLAAPGYFVRVTAGGIQLGGIPTISGTGLPPSVVGRDTSGFLFEAV